MPLVRRQFLQAAAGAALAAPFAGVSSAQAYPSRSVRVIVPVGAGGANDTSTRLIAQKLSESLKQQFYVENIVGAGGNIGMAQAMKAAPDGYTVLSVAPSFVINPTLNPKTPFDPVKDFAPVTLMCATPTVIVAHASLRRAHRQGADRAAQGQSGQIQLLLRRHRHARRISPANCSRRAYGVDIIHVPFTGGGPAMNSTIGGHTPISFPALSTAAPSILGGKVRGLAVMSPKRSPTLPTCRRWWSRASAISRPMSSSASCCRRMRRGRWSTCFTARS